MRIIFSLLFLLVYFSGSSQVKVTDSTAALPNKSKNLDFNVMPYLNYSRTLELMFGAVPMIMYRINKTDTISPKSLSGVSAVYTTNKSYFIASFNKFYFDEDKWRAQLFILTGDKNAQFYIDDIETSDFYDYATKTTLVSTTVQRKITSALYGGMGISYAHYDTTYEDDVNPSSVSSTNGIQLITMYDTRNDVYYPTKGSKAKIRWIAYPEWLGNDVNASKVYTEYNRYIPFREGTDVLAARLSGQFGIGNISFEQQVTIGGKDIRGYSEGKYRGEGLLAFQGEYRYNFNKKMGLVGFAGAATIYGSDTSSFNWKLYPGAGAGYRYRAFKNEKFNVGLDCAIGKGDWGLYFRIGEAF